MGRRLLLHLGTSLQLMRKQDPYPHILSCLLHRCLSGRPTKDNQEKVGSNSLSKRNEHDSSNQKLVEDGSEESESNFWNWKAEVAWLSKALEPAVQLYKWASSGSDDKVKTPPGNLSLTEILTNLQHSKAGIPDWSLSELTVGLYLIYLSQASAAEVEDFTGVQVFSDVIVQELIYYTELVKGSYKDSPEVLAKYSMLRERNILKFIKDSSVMRPGYYIGLDMRNKLVIFGIRGTHTIYDLITDVVSTGARNVSLDGFSSHFGTAEAARWYLKHELGTVRKCLQENKDFKLRIVGHSLGGAAAALLAIMIRKKSAKELGFNPEHVSAIGFGTPPCVSKELSELCASYVSTVILQDDIIPRVSAASLARLRNEIIETDWMSVLEKEDWKSIVDLVTNAKQVMNSMQDVARKVADYARFRTPSSSSENPVRRKPSSSSRPPSNASNTDKAEVVVPEELFLPGTQYYIKRSVEEGGASGKSIESYTLWKRNPGEHFQRIQLSGNFISDHKCESHYYALRDVLKSLPSGEKIEFQI